MNEREIFAIAAQKATAAECAAYLEVACGDDLLLRQRVEALLREHADLGSFLESPPPGIAAPFAPTITEPPLPDKSGTQIGPYKLLEQIGEGGFGIVFMAEQQHPVRRKVALKVLKPGMDTRQVIARFEAERQALALMDHPHIAKVLDAGATDSGRPYFVMELVKGVTITEYCDAHRLTPGERLELFVAVCQAVQHAHQKGIIHRDIKPSNVLVTTHDGVPVVKVIDFGVAKALGQQLTDKTLFTGIAQMIGTPLYMSPEQAELSGLDIDTRTDVYSLGVLLYELLTGTTPFDKERLKSAAFDEIRRIIREEEPQKPSTRLSSLGRSSLPSRTSGNGDASRHTGPAHQAGPTSLASVAALRKTEPRRLSQLVRGDLDWIVMKGLEKDRNRRYETASGFALDIQRYLADEPVAACPPSAAYRFQKFARRNRFALSAAGAVSLSLVLGMAVSTWQAIRATRAQHDAEVARKEEAAQRSSAEQRRIEADEQRTEAERRRVEAVEQRAEADRRRQEAQEHERVAGEQRDFAKEQELLARRHLYASQMNLAHQAWEVGHAARTLQLLEGQRPKFDQEDLRSFDWYYLWRLCHSRYRFTLSGHKGAVCSVAFSPDGKTLASGSDDLIVRVWDVPTRQERGALRGHTSSIRSVAFSPDGATLASGSLDSTVILWDVDAGRERFTLKGHTNHVLSVAFSPDGETLASGSHDATIKIWDVAKGQERLTLKHPGAIESVAFSPDGKTLASGGALGTAGVNVKAWDVATGEERFTIHTNGVRFLAFSPDGKTLASGHWDQTVRLWDGATGQQRSIPKWHGGGVSCVAFSPDGKTLASASNDRTVKLWDLVTGQEQVQSHVGPAYSVAFSPDGKTLASGGEDRTVKLWDLGMGSTIDALTKHEGSVRCVAFSPDSKILATRSDEQSVNLWDVATGQERVTLKGHTDNNWQLLPVAFSPDGTTLASASGDTVKLWNVASGEERRVLKHSSRCLAFSPDGRTLATGGGLTVTLWDVATGHEQGTLKMEQLVGSMAFAPDGETLATGLLDRVTLWDTATRRPRLSFPAGTTSTWILSVAFSPDGRTLAAARFDGTVMLCNPDTGQLRASLKGHTASTRSVTYHPDGKTLATGSEDGTVKIWDAVTGQERITLKGHTWIVFSVSFSPDGQTLATGSADGTVKLWRAATDKEALALKTELDPDDPDSPIADYNSGDRLGSSGRTGEAEEAYRRAMRRLEKLVVEFPDIPDYPQELARTYFALGLMFGKSSRLREAEQAYRKVIELKPDSPMALNNIAWILVTCDPKFRDPARAVELANRAVELMPQEGAYWNTLGVAHYRAGAHQAALDALQKSIEIRQHGDAFDFLFLGMAHWQLGDEDEARKWYEQAVKWMQKNKPDDDQLRRFRAEAEVELLNQHAEIFYTERIEQQPAHSHNWLRRARFLARRDEWERADQDLLKAVELSPEDLQLLADVADLYLRHNNPDKAISAYNRAIELRPANAQLRIRRDQVRVGMVATWNFDTGTGDWQVAHNSTISASDGILRIQATGPDPFVVAQVSAPPGWKELTLWVRSDQECHAQLFWATEDTSDFAEDRSIRFNLSPSSAGWTEVKVRFQPNARLTSLRLDPDNISDIQWDIEAIMLSNVDNPPP